MNKHRSTIRVPILLLAAALCAFTDMAARASFILLNNPSEFSATQTLITFDEGDFDGTFLHAGSIVTSYRGVEFEGVPGGPPSAGFDPSTPREFGPGGFAGQTELNEYFSGLRITLPGQTNQFGAEFLANTPGDFSFTLFEHGQQVDIVTIAADLTEGGYRFYAFEDSSLFDQVLVSGPGTHVVMDNLRFAAAPEPTTVALLSLGLAGLGFARRRR